MGSRAALGRSFDSGGLFHVSRTIDRSAAARGAPMPLSGSLALGEPVVERVLRATAEALRTGATLDASALDAAARSAGLAPAEDAIEEAGENPRLLVYGPAAHANRYQGLLYSRAGDAGVGLVALKDFGELDELPLFGRFVLHLHWLGGVSARPDEAEARESVESFLARLDELRERHGARIVWTAHNLLPHESAHPALDRDFRQALIDRCDAIHCMTEPSVARLRETFSLGDTSLFVVPHPSYEGAYPDYVDRAAARAILGIDPQARVILSFGAIQAYKGYDTLRAAFDRLRGDDLDAAMLLLIAGAPTDASETATLASWSRGRADVLFRPEKIADDDLQLVFKAADIAVCPYRETLNSGVATLALSFGLPVVAPDIGAFGALGDAGVLTYEAAGGSEACAEAMRAMLEEPGPWREGARRFVEGHRPADISRAFFDRIEDLWQ